MHPELEDYMLARGAGPPPLDTWIRSQTQRLRIKKWVLKEALEFLAYLQPWCEPRGYYVALAGGVLNKGMGKDLDLVLMPRWEATHTRETQQAFVKAMDQFLGMGSGITGRPTGWHIRYPLIKLELSMVYPAGSQDNLRPLFVKYISHVLEVSGREYIPAVGDKDVFDQPYEFTAAEIAQLRELAK